MTSDQDTSKQTDNTPDSSAERIRLLEQFRVQMKRASRLLEDFDVHGVSTEAEKAAFFDALAAEGEGLIAVFRRLVKEQGGSARARILRYLQAHVGQVVEGATLATVAGISAWARRVRELDVEQGYNITTNDSDPTLRPGQYRLESATPDTERAAWWQLKNRLRNDKKRTLQDKVLSLLTNRVGRPVDTADLEYVSKGRDVAETLHQLRSEPGGLKISSHLNRPDLKPDQFVLEAEDQQPSGRIGNTK